MNISVTVQSCGCVSKEGIRCARCGHYFCPKHIYSRVDGNNISITKNAKEYCEGCFKIVYGERE